MIIIIGFLMVIILFLIATILNSNNRSMFSTSTVSTPILSGTYNVTYVALAIIIIGLVIVFIKISQLLKNILN